MVVQQVKLLICGRKCFLRQGRSNVKMQTASSGSRQADRQIYEANRGNKCVECFVAIAV